MGFFFKISNWGIKEIPAISKQSVHLNQVWEIDPQ